MPSTRLAGNAVRPMDWFAFRVHTDDGGTDGIECAECGAILRPGRLAYAVLSPGVPSGTVPYCYHCFPGIKDANPGGRDVGYGHIL